VTLRILEIDPSEELELLRAERARRSFAEFCKRAWREIDPAPLVWGWHLDAICEHLQAVHDGRIRRLVINVPPGHAKSMIVSVLWPAWVWAKRPSWRMLCASYDLDLSMRDSVKTRTLIQTEWYQKHFTEDPTGRTTTEERWQLLGDQNVKSHYGNTALGFRQCVAIGSGTGKRGDALVIDDPISADDSNSKPAREKAIRWKTETMSSRFNDQASAQEVLVMQRLHEEDLTGYLLKAGGWVHLRLPSRYEVKRACKCETCSKGETPIGWKDPRKKEGDLLFPAKFPEHVLQEAESTRGMGAIAFAGQHQQRPMPAKGGLLKRAWFGRRWHFPTDDAPIHPEPVDGLVRRAYDPRTSRPSMRMIVTDAAFKKTEDSDLIAVGVVDLLHPSLYLIDFVWQRMGLIETIQAIVDLRKRWPGIGTIAIEDKANGSAIIEVLKTKFPGVTEVNPLGSKEARIMAAAPFFRAGDVWLPEAHPQIEEAAAEAAAFPKAAHDDWIDMLAYGVLLNLVSSDVSALEGLVKW
jgi:predicted phage terminase large subunit-like protein